jgi:rhamnosyltransferase
VARTTRCFARIAADVHVAFSLIEVFARNLNVKIATVVVTFRPERAVICKILGYTKYLDFVIVADNTDSADLRDSFSQQAKLEYIDMMGNQGIAKALNAAADRALELGYSWLLMLDQDSLLRENAYLTLKEQVTIQSAPDIGIISASQVSREPELKQHTSSLEFAEVDLLMTSGSILQLDAYRECGRFEEDLFIDHVDHEYCLRLQRSGYRTIQCANIVLNHAHGEVRRATVFGRTVTYIEHKPFRFYYFVRNGLYVGAKFFWYRPQFLRWVLLQIIKHLIKALLFQNQKLLRLKMFYWGLTDFCMGRYGVGHAIHNNFPL